MLYNAVTELETSGRRFPVVEDCVIAEVVHEVLLAGADGIVRKHAHAETIPE